MKVLRKEKSYTVQKLKAKQTLNILRFEETVKAM